ncbi:GMC family oxidoreductase [Micromonospora sp. WMMD812]|uniref:GMC oxidoreductase n=1 Tax=Micromonospora sp. WMMD812 TaxID=3015152 RepID=UPI00248BFB08|nr:GMC family oxidoreductase [Micromonospora sp. WMMD812]WBB70063.1 GMC family oxidoreductase [Micromonospora sp. WMMD812]
MTPTAASASRASDDGEYLSRDHVEALVIGSGFGGAVATCRLAQAGVDVAVIERGRRWRPGTFPRDLSRLDDGWLWVCEHGLYDVRPLNDILAVQAAGYGGGSLVYANVAARPPQEVFDAAPWPEPYSRDMLEPYYDLVAHMLDVRPIPPDPRTGDLPPKTRLMARAADQLGFAAGFFHPNLAITFADEGPDQVNKFGVPQRGCTFVGECDIGCNVGAKNSLDLNYLALAERHGALVGTRTEAVHLARTDDGGYRVRLREHGRPGAGRDGVRRDITARYVFVCAGALGTTELLLRSRDQYQTLPHLPAALGEGYSGNGDFLSFGQDMREVFEPGSGPTITTASVIRAGGREKDEEHWFVLEDGGYSQHLAKLVHGLDPARLPPEVGRAISTGTRRLLAAIRGTGATLDPDRRDVAVLLAMGRDNAEGRIELRGANHRLRITWDTTRSHPLYAEEQAFSADVVRAFGGRPFVTPTWRMFRQPITVHNLGGARMGTDPSTGVVNADGEVFGHPGLYVLDGAALPGPTGGNPSLTIAAVAERCIEVAIRRIVEGTPDWVAPQRAQVVRGPVPEDAATRAVVAQPPRRRSGAGVRFRETLRGGLITSAGDGAPGGRRRVAVRLHVEVPDLELFLADPAHTARLRGTAQVDGLTGQPAPVEGGTLHLLPAVDGGPRRTMDYSLPFRDDRGVRWLLRGSKQVGRHTGRGPWRATTVLDVALTSPDDRYESLVPTGRLTISVADVVRLLASLRATETTGRETTATVFRFVRFFTTEVARALLSRRVN